MIKLPGVSSEATVVSHLLLLDAERAGLQVPVLSDAFSLTCD